MSDMVKNQIVGFPMSRLITVFPILRIGHVYELLQSTISMSLLFMEASISECTFHKLIQK